MSESRPKRPRRSAKPAAEDKNLRKFVIEAARLMNDRHCEDVVVFDVRGRSDVTDYIVVGSGTSDRQIRAVGQEIEDLGKASNMPKFGADVDGPSKWLVLDFVTVVVHLFEPAMRGHYDLEMLWGDAPRLKWRRTATKKSDDEE